MLRVAGSRPTNGGPTSKRAAWLDVSRVRRGKAQDKREKTVGAGIPKKAEGNPARFDVGVAQLVEPGAGAPVTEHSRRRFESGHQLLISY